MQPEAEQRIRAEAERRGVDPDKAVAHAESLAAKQPPAESEPAATGKPTFERLLLGALPFMTVREFRAGWLGLTAALPDDHLTCGEFAAKYGGAAAAPAPDAEPPA